MGYIVLNDGGFVRAERVLTIGRADSAAMRRLLASLPRGKIVNLTGGRRRQAVIVLAHNLTPSETANLNRAFVRGFATEIGGPGSHTAIVAEGLEIPAVVGIGALWYAPRRRRTRRSGGELAPAGR